MTDPAHHQRKIAHVFEQAAPGYDRPALRFFPLCASRLVELARLPTGARVLDVGTGTGAAAISAAMMVGAAGRVTGIDLAPTMLAIARENAASAGLTATDFREMDASQPDFPDATFDVVICAFGLFLMPDEIAALTEWRRLLTPGGLMAFSVFGEDAFQPLSDLFVARLQEFGVSFRTDQRPFATQKIVTPAQCRDRLQAAGFGQIETHTDQVGYHLASGDDWWDVVMGSGFRGTLARLDPAKLDDFKSAHLADVETARTEDGIWVNVPAIFAYGRKP